MKLFKRLAITLALTISVAFMAFATSVHSASASSSPSIAILGGPGTNICSNTSFSVPISVNSNAVFSDSASMSVPGIGNVYSFSENDPAVSGTFPYFVSPNSYTVAPNTPVTVSITTYNGINGGGGVSFSSTAVINCSSGALLSVTNSGVIPGPGIPSGFVLHTITCTVAVYDSAGGNPVSGATIIGGQTWFVSPTPVKDSKGKLWTEIFVGSAVDGFIPTSCVH
ncbi:MAG: hypothetical protein ACYDBJ_26495 [Aggregatilineales bacterium]